MIPFFAVGNAGPECKTARSPSDYSNVIAGGSITSGDNLSSFSSKGPSLGGLVKPNITAPGTSITSAWYMDVNTYATASGTSQAAPHVSGVASLMLSARPISAYDDVESVLLSTTQRGTLAASEYTCGNTADYNIPNNQYDNGRVVVLAAMNAIIGVPPVPSPTSKPGPIPTGRCIGLNELFCGGFLCEWTVDSICRTWQ